MGCRYELFMDDLPVWGFVGPPPEETKDEEHIYIYTHKSFDINYNDNRVRIPTATCLPYSLLMCMLADYQSKGISWFWCIDDTSQNLPCLQPPALTESRGSLCYCRSSR